MVGTRYFASAPNDWYSTGYYSYGRTWSITSLPGLVFRRKAVFYVFCFCAPSIYPLNRCPQSLCDFRLHGVSYNAASPMPVAWFFFVGWVILGWMGVLNVYCGGKWWGIWVVWKKISNFVSPIWCWACVKSPKTIAPWLYVWAKFFWYTLNEKGIRCESWTDGAAVSFLR